MARATSRAPRKVTLSGLLKKGYFPRELPPPFNTKSFAKVAVAVGASWAEKWTNCVRHNLARPGGLRRPLRIPNPISYFKLAETLVSGWAALRLHTWQTRLSASRPYVIKRSVREIVPRYSYGELPRLRALRRRSARYLLTTDINQFYPTIYTHTIPWSLHTKIVCKSSLGAAGKALLGNKIDAALMSMNDGQTHGIPIGPDSSFLVAEVLLSIIDQALLKEYGRLLQGFRYVDDYELSFSNLSNAEMVQTALQGLLAEYELILNPIKTKIEELPKPLDDSWAIELKQFTIRVGSATSQRNDLLALFSKAYEFASVYPRDYVLKYAVARVRRLSVHPGAWRTFQNGLLGAAAVDPSTMAAALGTLYEVAALGGHTVYKSPLAEVFESVIVRHAPRGEGSEVAWALWGAIAWDVPLSTAAAQAVSTMDDDVVTLLALDADQHGLFPTGSLDKQRWANVAREPEVLRSEHWLLAYEANQQKWLRSPAVAKHKIFNTMRKAGVSFYDRSACSPQVPLAALPIPGGKLPDYYA